MTAQENAAIYALTSLMKSIDQKNDDAHSGIKEELQGVREELKGITAHCHDRERIVDDLLSEQRRDIDKHIVQARDEAIYAATAPPAWQVGARAFAVLAAKVIGIIGTGVGIGIGVDKWIG